jgi:predicted ABC-type ATPase
MPRLRVFAGPNGSGKSTIIKTVQQHKQNGRLLNMGIYINADDIAQDLKSNRFYFINYHIHCSRKQLIDFAKSSGLLSKVFSLTIFSGSFSLAKKDKVTLRNPAAVEYLAQIIARFLRAQMLETKQTFSFETVFSHPSNLEIMQQAAAAGFKVYLYFVSTESPEINKYRVKIRVKQKGHGVPEDKIESRYYRSLELLYDAAAICHQSYFFDNSGDSFKPVAQLKAAAVKQILDEAKLPKWFKKYYLDKKPTQ